MIHSQIAGQTLVRCSLHFTGDLLASKAQFNVGLKKRLKPKDDAVLNILDLIVMSQDTSVSNCFHYVVTIALSPLTDHLICIELFMRF